MAYDLLYADHYSITDQIAIRIPTVGEILDHSEEYYRAAYSLVATPYDLIVPLDELGIDFSKVDEYDVFCLSFGTIKQNTVGTSLLFADLDLDGFHFMRNEELNSIVLRNDETGAVIDKAVQNKIATVIRTILNLPKNNKKPGNEEARKYMLERARKKAKRRGHTHQSASPLEGYIVSLVNTEQFPYNYTTVRDISIYQLYASLKQIIHKISYDNSMIGVYAGTVKFDDLKKEQKSWVTLE